jgi:hypothetical protein
VPFVCHRGRKASCVFLWVPRLPVDAAFPTPNHVTRPTGLSARGAQVLTSQGSRVAGARNRPPSGEVQDEGAGEG